MWGASCKQYSTSFLYVIWGNEIGTFKHTIQQSEIKNRWSTFYSYIPESLCSNNIDIVSFKDGQIYKHNSNSVYNNFYGVDGSMIMNLISNITPGVIKVYNHIFIESSHPFLIPSATNQFEQKTSLIVDDFKDVEGVWKSEFLQDENTPNVDNPLIEGDTIRCHSLDIVMENKDKELVKLFSIGIGIEVVLVGWYVGMCYL